MSTDEQTESYKRIRRAWEIQEDNHEEQYAAVGVLTGWLTEPLHQFHALRLLLLDPEIPTRDASIEGVIAQTIDPAWGGAGTHPSHLKTMQAMVLSAWPKDACRIATLFDDAFAQTPGRSEQRGELEKWRAETREPVPQKAQPAVERRTVTAPSVEPSEPEQDPASDLRGAYNALRDDVAQSMPISAAPELRTKLELLWWGESHVCGPNEELLEQMSVPNKLWCAAKEISERGACLRFRPLCGYLLKTLRGVEVSLDEAVDLSTLMEETGLAARESEYNLGDSLRQLTEVSRFALPASASTLSGESDSRPWVSDSATRGQWAVRLLAEFCLAEALP